MYHWFHGLSGTPTIKANWVKAIWHVSHPPSYLLAIKHMADRKGLKPEKLDKFYARHTKQFEDCLWILTSSVKE
jgi:hypothetical protein